jgi:hypothetical protein
MGLRVRRKIIIFFDTLFIKIHNKKFLLAVAINGQKI